MKKIAGHIVQIFFVCFLLLTPGCKKQGAKDLSDAGFKTPPNNVKIHTWWHWMDGNITKEGISKDLEAMKEQGIVQATILNIGLLGDKDFGIKKVNFNSPKWFEMFQWALKEANRLGISIGAHNCDGWSTSGGPWITPEMSMKQYTWTKTIVNASQPASIKLKQPFAVRNFYKDVAVVAVKTTNTLNSFQSVSPAALLNDTMNADYLFDGCPASALAISKGDKITFRFNNPFTAEKIVLLPRRTFMWGGFENFTSTYSLASSEDGRNFKKITDLTVKGLNNMVSFSFPKTTGKFFQLSLTGTNNLESWSPFYIAECELLSENEKPLFSPEIEYLAEKTGNIKASRETDFYSASNSSNQKSNAKEVIDLSSKMSSDGTLNWKPGEGNWTIIRFGYTSTGALNQPATAQGMGLECDKMDTAAVNLHFNSFPAKLIEKAGSFTGNTFKFMLIDSWECGFQNWTANMGKEFEQRRGYSLTSYLPVLCGESSGNAETDEAVLFDLRQTIAELIENNYYKHFGDLLHKNKMEFHSEIIYGNSNYPALDILKTTQYVDLPMYEFWSSTNNEQNVTYYPANGIELNMPSCAAIGYEKPVMASEAYTGMAHYCETPGALKPFGDRAYCAGVNQMILHSYVHQPNDNKPGMTLGIFGSHFNRNNNYWPYISEWLTYQSRVQHVLQQGVASHDVLYYLGDQLPQYLTYNQSNKLPFGFMFNACNFDVLKNRIRAENGKLVLNGKNSYQVLCLPPYGTLNFETVKRIEELVKEGVVLYAPKPGRMLSLNDIKNNKKAFDELTSRIWGKIDGKSVTSNNYGKGKVYWGIPLAEVLKAEKIFPDVNTQQDDSVNFMFIHKKVDGNDVYFMMNQQNNVLRREVSFRVTGKTPEIWDAEYGTIIKPAVYSMNENYTTLPVSFKPYQSLIFVFKNEKPENFIQVVRKNGNLIFPAGKPSNLEAIPSIVIENNSYMVNSETEGDFELFSNQQKNWSMKSPKLTEFTVSDFSGTTSFQPGYSDTIQPVEFTRLQWLTESENADVKYFSGTSTYTISFKFSFKDIQPTDSILLDLGEFESIAELKLNGTNLGYLSKPGKLIPVKGILKTENILEVSVANIFRNRIIGDFAQYGKIRNLSTSSPISDFLNKDSPLKPSGLKGPIKIIAISRQILD
jgi:hypothetical protein